MTHVAEPPVAGASRRPSWIRSTTGSTGPRRRHSRADAARSTTRLPGRWHAKVDFASVEEVDAAVAAARGVPGWRATSPRRRTEIMFRIRNLVDQRRKEIAALLTAEHGKVPSDALGEVARGLENLEFACGIPHLLKGGYSEQVEPGIDVYQIRQPLGVVAGITPFNFPAMVPMWMFANAIACGNTFILKPSEKDPSASVFSPSCSTRRACRTASSTSSTATRWRSIGSSITPTSRRSRSSARRRSRSTSTRPGRRTASACRRSAAPRTTWSCCPTRTSTWPPTPRSRPPTARPASGAWRSRSSSPSATWPIRWSRRSRSGCPRSRSARATRRARRWARWSRASTATRSPSYLDMAPARARPFVPTAASTSMYSERVGRLLPRRLA